MSGRTVCDGSAPAAFTELSGTIADQLEVLQAKYEDRDGFRAAIFDGTSVAVVVDSSRLSDWEQRAAKDDLRLYVSCVSSHTMAAAKDLVDTSKLYPDMQLSVGYDALVDAEIVLTTDADAAANQLDQNGVDVPSAIETGSLRVQQEQPDFVSEATRGSDSAPFWGGGRIRLTVDSNTWLCTTGMYLNSSTYGTVMLTAGHCTGHGTEGQTGVAVKNGDETASLGVTEGAYWPSPDIMLIDGSPYQAWTYSANDNSSASPVLDSGYPATGVTYCQFGATLQKTCFQLTALDTDVCYSGGVCTHHLAETEGPACPGCQIVSGGDSGGGMFRLISGGVGARGMVNAQGSDTNHFYAWFTKLQTVLNTYNATVELN